MKTCCFFVSSDSVHTLAFRELIQAGRAGVVYFSDAPCEIDFGDLRAEIPQEQVATDKISMNLLQPGKMQLVLRLYVKIICGGHYIHYIP